MTEQLSPNTQVILLLTAPLLVGSRRSGEKPLSLGEYKRLACRLRNAEREPADLLDDLLDDLLGDCGLDPTRVESLLARGLQLSQAIERWHARSIWVISRADADYPKRFKQRLGMDTPPVLYGCGDRGLLATGGLAVVGSRDIDEELIRYTENVGRLAAAAGRTLISGGARGIDQASMRGALAAGGASVGVLADGVERAALNGDNRHVLIDGRLVLVSPYDPTARFHVGHAMQRNKLIYALADSALVVNSSHGKGGTWTGAVEQLDKLHFVPVYTRAEGNGDGALEALRQRGARVWPEPETPGELRSLLEAKEKTAFTRSRKEQQASLFGASGSA